MPRSPLIGCIADDFTGGTDLAGMFVANGLSTVQTIGTPRRGLSDTPDLAADVIVVALKSRTLPRDEAVARSLGALAWLREAGCRQIYLKYCSTFDSTPEGNIGPVADAVMDELNAERAIVCPAFPANGRTVYKGHLFVGDNLLSDSGMRHHPLTPMTQSSLLRLLTPQTRHAVGLIDRSVVADGAAAIARAVSQAEYRYLVLDTLTDADLMEIGSASVDMPLVTGGSGLALGLARALVGRGEGLGAASPAEPARSGSNEARRAVVSGSCSTMTLRQVATMRAVRPSLQIRPADLAGNRDVVGEAIAFAHTRMNEGPVLIYATAQPEEVAEAQAAFGRAGAGERIETALSAIARGLVAAGVTQMIVAGGETSGAVVQALGIEGLRIGREITPGVPWTRTIPSSGAPLDLALKSGNFGRDDFFLDAWRHLS